MPKISPRAQIKREIIKNEDLSLPSIAEKRTVVAPKTKIIHRNFKRSNFNSINATQNYDLALPDAAPKKKQYLASTA